MKVAFSLEKIFKKKSNPLFLSVILLICLSSIFILSYAYVNYRGYLKSYLESQAFELKMIQKRKEEIVKDFHGLLELTIKRFQTSANDVQKIQKILNSFDFLSLNANLPSIQKFSYYKLTPTPTLITRFGVIPFPLEHYPTETHINKGIFIRFQGEKIIGKSRVLNENNELVGILEAELSDFKSLVGNLVTLSFDKSAFESKLIHEEPFSLYAKSPDSYGKFMLIHKSHYLIFILYGVLCTLLAIFSFYSIHRHFQKKYENTMTDLENSLAQKREEAEKLLQTLENQKQEHQNHQLSYQAIKTFYTQLNERQKKQALSITRSLNVVRASLDDSAVYLSDKEREELLDSCITNSQLLSNRSLGMLNREQFNIKMSLEYIQLFFAEKLYKSNILLDISCPPTVLFEGDRFLNEFILLNLIGKSIYRVPKNGKVFVRVSQEDGLTSFEIQDNGYSLSNVAEKLIKKSFDLLMEDQALYQLCLENGIMHEHSRSTDSINITKITFSNTSQEIFSDNVVQLFEKNY